MDVLEHGENTHTVFIIVLCSRQVAFPIASRA